jgi:hypothetical protein
MFALQCIYCDFVDFGMTILSVQRFSTTAEKMFFVSKIRYVVSKLIFIHYAICA